MLIKVSLWKQRMETLEKDFNETVDSFGKLLDRCKSEIFVLRKSAGLPTGTLDTEFAMVIPEIHHYRTYTTTSAPASARIPTTSPLDDLRRVGRSSFTDRRTTSRSNSSVGGIPPTI